MGRTENLDERVFCCLWTPRLHTMPHWEGDILANPISSLLIVQRLLGYQWNSGLLHSVAVALVLLQSKGGCWYPRTSPGLEPSWPATYVAQCSEGSVRGLTQKRRKHEWCPTEYPTKRMLLWTTSRQIAKLFIAMYLIGCSRITITFIPWDILWAKVMYE